MIFVISIGVHSTELQYVPLRHREPVYSSGVDHKETLSWAVKLNLFLLDDEDISIAADAVAADIGLHNHGQIGVLVGYYVLSHPSGLNITQSSFSSSVFQDQLTTFSREELRHMMDRVHLMLDHHPFVEWYMIQRVAPRFKRKSALKRKHGKSSYSVVHFNDPMYHKQWHLVANSSC